MSKSGKIRSKIKNGKIRNKAKRKNLEKNKSARILRMGDRSQRKYHDECKDIIIKTRGINYKYLNKPTDTRFERSLARKLPKSKS